MKNITPVSLQLLCEIACFADDQTEVPVFTSHLTKTNTMWRHNDIFQYDVLDLLWRHNDIFQYDVLDLLWRHNDIFQYDVLDLLWRHKDTSGPGLSPQSNRWGASTSINKDCVCLTNTNIDQMLGEFWPPSTTLAQHRPSNGARLICCV